MRVVDSHCHAGESWFEPVESLIQQMDSNGVDKGVLIQHMGMFENSYLLKCSERFPGRFSVVALVNHRDPNACENLSRLAEQGVVGVRLGPTVRSPGKDKFLIWKKALSLGLSVSSLGNLEDFASDKFKELITEVPSLPLVIEHLGGIRHAENGSAHGQFHKVLDLSEYPGIYIKVPGLGEISSRPEILHSRLNFDHMPPLIEMVKEAFGVRRMMWGSDFPPVSSREGYRNALNGVLGHPSLSKMSDREWVMGKTASVVFNIN